MAALAVLLNLVAMIPLRAAERAINSEIAQAIAAMDVPGGWAVHVGSGDGQMEQHLYPKYVGDRFGWSVAAHLQ
jgi:hypothetical protein